MKMLDRKLVRELYRAKGLLLAITSIISVGVMWLRGDAVRLP